MVYVLLVEQWKRIKVKPASRIDGEDKCEQLVIHWEETYSRTSSANIIFKNDSFISWKS